MLVAYRACPIGSIKPRPIDGEKINLIRLCFDSFLDAFSGVDYELIVIIDKPDWTIREVFSSHKTLEVFYEDLSQGNVGTFHTQIDTALHHKKPFLFVEDDYYWKEGAGQIIYDALNELDKGFITPYDHPDHYQNPEFVQRDEKVSILGNHHFKTTLSTTLTFGGTYESLKAEADLMKTYGWADHPMWVDITQRLPLYSAIPSLATHMETPWIAPVVEWPF